MNQRAAYLLQILEKIGAPLTSAAGIVAATDGDAAKNVAALLGKTVQSSIDLGQVLDINPGDAQDDSLRVALAGLAGPLVAEQYRKKGQVPEDADLKKITASLKAVLTFSDNFTPDENNTKRLENLNADGQAADIHQTTIQYIGAFIPVVQAIAAFPFGQAEQKLIMDVTDRLVRRAAEMRENLLSGLTAADEKPVELGLLTALAKLYSACHLQETDRVMKLDEAARTQGLSIDVVWTSFDTQAAMLEALAKNLIPAGASGQGAGSKAPATAATTPPPAPPPEQPPAPPPVQKTPAAPVVEQPTPPPAQAQPPAQPATPPPSQPPASPPPTTPPAGDNPMAMFAKKPSGGDATPPPPPAAPAAPPAEQPPAPPPVQEPPATQTPPPAQPPAENSDQKGEGEQDSGGGNPMSFFKKGD